VIKELTEMGAEIVAFDPEAIEEAQRVVSNPAVSFASDSYQALSGADALVIVTEWNEFRRPSFDKLKEELKTPLVFDGRNLYDPDLMKERGFVYFSIGRPAVV
jgi:UDPglucose 6-dehydrogenase